MPERILILGVNDFEQEIAEILDGQGYLCQLALRTEGDGFNGKSSTYRDLILNRAGADAIDVFHRVVLYVEQPVRSSGGTTEGLQIAADDLKVLMHLKERTWLSRMILVQRGKAETGDLRELLSRQGVGLKPLYILGRPYGHEPPASYALQLLKAARGKTNGAEVGLVAWLGKIVDSPRAKKILTAIGLLISGTGLIAKLIWR